MAAVSITIDGRQFRIACEEGDTSRIEKLAQYVDEKVKELRQSVTGVSDLQIMTMTCLMLADELSDAQKASQEEKQDTSSNVDGFLEHIENLASRVEHIAGRLEKR